MRQITAGVEEREEEERGGGRKEYGSGKLKSVSVFKDGGIGPFYSCFFLSWGSVWCVFPGRCILVRVEEMRFGQLGKCVVFVAAAVFGIKIGFLIPKINVLSFFFSISDFIWWWWWWWLSTSRS